MLVEPVGGELLGIHHLTLPSGGAVVEATLARLLRIGEQVLESGQIGNGFQIGGHRIWSRDDRGRDKPAFYGIRECRSQSDGLAGGLGVDPRLSGIGGPDLHDDIGVAAGDPVDQRYGVAGNGVGSATIALLDDVLGDRGVELGRAVIQVGEDDRAVDLAGVACRQGRRRNQRADDQGEGITKHCEVSPRQTGHLVGSPGRLGRWQQARRTCILLEVFSTKFGRSQNDLHERLSGGES